MSNLKFESEYAKYLYEESRKIYDWSICDTDVVITEEFVFQWIYQIAKSKGKILRFRCTWE